MKKALFLDRDGTLIVEPPTDYQVDSYAKLAFLPGVLVELHRLVQETDYELVMVTNQDGLGTASFPEADFWPVHELMMDILASQGIHFSAVHIDRSFPHENLPSRKPGTAMLTDYLKGDYDLAHSYVIGDRLTDVQLAQNLGAKALLIGDPGTEIEYKTQYSALAAVVPDWVAIYHHLRRPPRRAEVVRATRETDIRVVVNLDGTGQADIATGLGFFDHMLEQIARHGGVDLSIHTQGDLQIDEHHTIEDTGLALGEALSRALGDKRGISRYGFLLPMDDALAQVALDFSGRNWLVWEAQFRRDKVGDMPTEMFSHFFKSLSDSARCNLHIRAEGENEHHKIEAIFKGFARALRMAVARTAQPDQLPSTKGVL